MKPGTHNLFSALSILLLLSVSRPVAQTQQRDNRPRTASISGRVTIGGAPATNALVTAMEVDQQTRGESFGGEPSKSAFIKVRTDSDGRYHFAGLTEGAYMIRALSNAYVISKSSTSFDIFRSVTLDEGESRDSFDIALVRGGVITGRVINAEGRPIIAGYIHLLSLDENGKPMKNFDLGYRRMFQTDDRGVYRLYGLPAGRYILSAGDGYGRAIRKYPRTFYPDTTDQSQAKIIEVKEGAEVINIDIRLGVGKNTYEAAGRVVDAETGQPLPQVLVYCWEAPDKENGGGRDGGEAITDDEGRFRVAGLGAGQYEMSLSASRRAGAEHYSEKMRFEVNDSDVSGLEIKAIRGSTISGVFVIEGVNDPAVKAKLPQMTVSIEIMGKRESAGDGPTFERRGAATAKIASDGGFRLTGASPGMASFYIWGSQGNDFSIKRIERDGQEIRSALEIGRGEQITGVRIVVAYANGTIRGQVGIAGGKLPEGWHLQISASPIKTTAGDQGYPVFHSNNWSAMVDEKGRFVIERLVAGEYELTLSASVITNQGQWDKAPGTSEIKQRVAVSSGAETMVKLTFDPARR